MTTNLHSRSRLINSNSISFSIKHLIVFLIGFLFVAVGYGQTFTDNTPAGSETWTVPAGVTSISVQAWGAGGAGGGSTVQNNGGSGGGGGGYAIRTFAVTPGQMINYTIGVGGVGSNGNGTAGGNTTILALSANGGAGGTANGGAGGAGGNATGGIPTNTTGANGAAGGGNPGGDGGAGANGGAGGAGASNGPGGVGQIPGGGGGGAERQGSGSAGGAGGVGQITITWTPPPPCNAPATINAATAITSVSATISWTAAVPAPSNGYDWEVRTSGAGGSGATGLTASGSTGAGITTANVTGLTVLTTYSIYVRSNCGASQSTWTGPVNFTTTNSSPPPNDQCGGAIALTVNGDQSCGSVTSGTVLNSTDSNVFNPNNCGGTDDDDVWYTFVATSTSHTVDLLNVVGTTTVDLYHAVYAFNPCSTGGSDTALTCSDPDSSTTGGLTIGNTYYVQVYTWSSIGGRDTTFDICIGTPPGAPANDACSSPTPLTVNPDFACGTVTPGTVFSATNSGVDNCNGTEDDDVWYSFVATATSHRVSLINIAGSTTDMYHAVYSAGGVCSGATAPLICNDGNVSDITGLTIGNTYLVQVYTWTSFTGQTSTFDVCVGTPPPCVAPTSPGAPITFDSVQNDFISASFSASVPAASNYLVLMNTTGVPPAVPSPATIYNIGDTSLGATVIDNDNDTIFTAPGLTQLTTYHFYIYAFNNSLCSGGPLYSGSYITGNATTPVPTYCVPSSTNTGFYIDDFTTTGGSTNINHLGSGFSAGGYGDFTGLPPVTQLPASAINFTAVHVGGTFQLNIWVDWNNDLDFDDPNEQVFNAPAYIATQNGSFTVLSTALPGNYRMRVRTDWSNTNVSSCGFDDRSETHDYTLIVTPLNCTDNPLSLTAVSTTTTTATISWTDPVPAPALGYEWIVSTDNSTSTPGNDITGTTAATLVNLTGLLGGTTYYVFVRGVCNAVDNGIWIPESFNTGCANLVSTPTVCPTIVSDNVTDPFTATPFVADPGVQLDCNVGDVTLQAYSNLYETTSYAVEKIAYNKVPADFTPTGFGTGPVLITSDDVWAPTRSDIGFPFCFYGNTYTQALAGSNGALTFDQSILPNSFHDWSFSSDIPNIGDYTENTIHAVYHDIDPRFLVSPINTALIGTAPCREFRVAWHDIPMFGDPSRLYTGMIVLYETTNIIEIFIEEKLIENGDVFPWNGGNAAVGIQGDITPLAPNNEFAYAPCRNGLDTNWETTNEAWRFTPNGAAIAPDAITWYQGSVAPANVLLDNGDGTVTVNTPDTYIAVSDYTLCSGPVSLMDDTVLSDTRKTWNGSASRNWYTAANWSPPVIPTPSDCVVIPPTATTSNRSPIISRLNTTPLPPTTPGYALSVEVQTDGYLEIAANSNLLVTDYIDLDGTIDIRDSGSLIQVIDGADNVNSNTGTGTMTMERTVPTGVNPSDYVYWSSPTDEDFNVTLISDAAGELIFEWNPTTDGINYGDWIAASGTMVQGRGYIVRGLVPTAPLPANTTAFTGFPQNGVVKTPITRGTYDGPPYQAGTPPTNRVLVTRSDDNWNLIGNPYPSAIDYSTFINAVNNPHIDGTVYFWTHAGTPIRGGGSPFYSDFLYNYPSDYISYNGSGANPPGSSNGNIAAGQGFFVEMLHTTPSTTEDVTFNNTMRDITIDNSEFFRTDGSSQPPSGVEKHRIWLDLINSDLLATSILVGYIEGATNGKDRIFDGHELAGTNKSFYSLIEEDKMSIQGRSLPFDENDTVSLGLYISETGNYTIAINTLDGLFLDSDQAIYLEDTYNGIKHDLRVSPYSFNIDAGTYNDRFVLRYDNEALGVDEYQISGIEILAPNNSFIKVKSGNSAISTVVVYDLLGRVLLEQNEINNSEISINNHKFSEGTYIVKATLVDGIQKIQKVVLKH